MTMAYVCEKDTSLMSTSVKVIRVCDHLVHVIGPLTITSQSITRGIFIIYIIKIILLYLKAVTFIKHRITRGFNTIRVLVENLIGMRA
jgi:hypothetical protein